MMIDTFCCVPCSCAPILVAAVEPGVADTMWPSWGMLVCQSGLHILAALMATLAEPVTQAQVRGGGGIHHIAGIL